MRLYLDTHIFQLQDYGGISRYFSTFLLKDILESLNQSGLIVDLHSPLHSNNYLKELNQGIMIQEDFLQSMKKAFIIS